VSIFSPNLSGDISNLDLGISYLATYLNQRTGHRAGIVDFTYHRKDWRKHLARAIRRQEPDVIGISCVSFYMRYVKMICEEIKNHYGLPIILGGYHPSIEPDDSLRIKEVDAVCIGDGEFALAEYLDRMESGSSPDGVEGIWYKDGERIVRNPKRGLMEDIDSRPVPDFDLWEDIDRFFYYQGYLYFIGSIGCPFNCTYCGVHVYKREVPGSHYRKCDPRRFANEIKDQWERYRGRGMRLAHIFDSVFDFDRDWTEAFCDEYIRIGLSDVLPYSIFSRIDASDAEGIELLARSGCRLIRFGIETGSDRIRNEVYKKQITSDQVRETVTLCKRKGITMNGYYILGGPGETNETLNETYRLAKEIDVERPVFFTYRPIPKSIAAEQLISMGGQIHNELNEGIDSYHWNSNVETGDLSPRAIDRYRNKMILIFLMRRVLRLIRLQKHRFFIDMTKYILRGLADGIDPKYLVGSALVCCGDNLTH